MTRATRWRLSVADANIVVEVSTQDAQKRLLYLHRENARLRRRIMNDAVTSDEAASSVANLAQSLADARAEIDLLRAALAKIAAGMCIDPCTVAREALGPNDAGNRLAHQGQSG